MRPDTCTSRLDTMFKTYGEKSSVPDPHPYVFGPPGSVSHKYDPDPALDLSFLIEVLSGLK